MGEPATQSSIKKINLKIKQVKVCGGRPVRPKLITAVMVNNTYLITNDFCKKHFRSLSYTTLTYCKSIKAILRKSAMIIVIDITNFNKMISTRFINIAYNNETDLLLPMDNGLG